MPSAAGGGGHCDPVRGSRPALLVEITTLLPRIFHCLDQDRPANLDVWLPGQQPQHQLGNVLTLQTFVVIETSAVFRHFGDHHAGTDRIDPNILILVLPLDERCLRHDLATDGADDQD